MLVLLEYVLVMALTLGVLVAFHEYGHFIIARLCGVKVLEFSIGFGPRLFSFKDKHDTQFSLALLPLGGFVKMLDEREGEVEESLLPYAFTQKTVGQRIAIVSAGPIANFILAICIYWIVFLPGTDALKSQVFSVERGSVAEAAGLQIGDVITAVDDEPVDDVQGIMMQLIHRLGDTGTIEFQLSAANTVSLPITQWLGDEEGNVDTLSALGFQFYRPMVKPIINEILKDSAASDAGLQTGDLLLQADDLPMADWLTWVDYVQARADVAIQLQFEREGEILQETITPKSIEHNGQAIGQVGIAVAWPKMPEELIVHTSYNALTAWLPALDRTWQTAKFSLVSIKKMILGQLSYKQLSGPITIAKVATQSAQSGIYSYLSLLALLSVSLGVLNLLPIPVLDGGHIFFYIIEWLKGSPVPESIQTRAFQLGLSLILAVMVLAFANDISRL